MERLSEAIGIGVLMGAMLIVCPGCSTKAAKKALNKPYAEDTYSGFGDKSRTKDSKAVRKAEPIGDDMAPDQAIDLLIDQLQRKELAYVIPAEDELHYWAQKQGVAEIIVRKVRLLLKDPRIEVRAPALRLTMTYGGKESVGDLIEVLGDEEFGMRESAFKKLKLVTGRDMGFDPSGGDLARVKSIESWRQWWQDEQRNAVAGSAQGVQGLEVAPPQLVEPNAPNAPAAPVEAGLEASAPTQDQVPERETKSGEPTAQNRFYTPREEETLPPPRDRNASRE
ncbi:MAG: hypothetical protein AMXMBFR7_41720 [Planctomycetota bacterium]